jgi:hypothetical protein
MTSAAAAGRSVLFISHRHQAIDAVQNRLEGLVGDIKLLARAYDGTQEGSFSFKEAVGEIIKRQTGTQTRKALEERNNVIARHGSDLDDVDWVAWATVIPKASGIRRTKPL